jgi:tRNA dimethylallyltransferase
VALIRPLIIAGPTASGKSDLALRIAERDNGCVINADALQVYNCWRVLTARPGPKDTARARHRLYGHVSCSTRYSVGAWLRDLESVLTSCRWLGQRPIIVGGTGLYLTALTEGLADIPNIPQGIRSKSELLMRTGGVDALLADLAKNDRDTFDIIDTKNPVRVQRAWEVFAATGRGLTNWQKEKAPALLPREACECIVINIDKAHLNKSIEYRFNKMMKDGALNECQCYLNSGLDLKLPSAMVLGANPLISYLRGELDIASATAETITSTRQYAKRQRSWFRGRMSEWTWMDPTETDPITTISERKTSD